MPPRRRGLSRIDAAIDAMLPLGFTPTQVRKCVNQLLKEYGGRTQMRFIEEDSYIELIAELLREVERNNQKEAVQDGDQITQDQSVDKYNGEGEPSNAVAVAAPSLGWKDDVLQHQTFVTKRSETSPKKSDSKRIKPCYGWIEDDEEYDKLKEKSNGPCYILIEDDDEDDEWKDKSNGKEESSMTRDERFPVAVAKPASGRQMSCRGWIEDEDDEEEDA